MNPCFLTASVALLIGSSSASAQIVGWDVFGQNAGASNPLAASILDESLASATLGLGPGVTASSTNNTFGATGFNQTSLSDAITAGDYISISLTPINGTTLSLTSVSLLFGVGTAVSNFNVALTTSATGFASGDALWTYSFATASPAAQNVALGEYSELQALDVSTELRLYGWRDPSGTSTFRIRDNSGYDVSIAGSLTAIPEPTTWATAMGGVALAIAAGCRRCRRGA